MGEPAPRAAARLVNCALCLDLVERRAFPPCKGAFTGARTRASVARAGSHGTILSTGRRASSSPASSSRAPDGEFEGVVVGTVRARALIAATTRLERRSAGSIARNPTTGCLFPIHVPPRRERPGEPFAGGVPVGEKRATLAASVPHPRQSMEVLTAYDGPATCAAGERDRASAHPVSGRALVTVAIRGRDRGGGPP